MQKQQNVQGKSFKHLGPDLLNVAKIKKADGSGIFEAYLLTRRTLKTGAIINFHNDELSLHLKRKLLQTQGQSQNQLCPRLFSTHFY